MPKFQSYLPNTLNFYKFWKVDVKRRSNREHVSHLLTLREMCDILLLARRKEQVSFYPCGVQSALIHKAVFVTYLRAVCEWKNEFRTLALGKNFRFCTVTLVILSALNRYIFRKMYLRGKGDESDVKNAAHSRYM